MLPYAIFQVSRVVGRLRSGWLGEVPHRGAHCQLVTEGAQAGDDTGRDVGEVRMSAKRLARVGVREMHFHERQAYREQRVAQGNAGMGKGRRVENQKTDAGGRSAVDLADELGFRVALQRDELVARLASQFRGTLFDGLARVGSVNPRLPPPEPLQLSSS